MFNNNNILQIIMNLFDNKIGDYELNNFKTIKDTSIHYFIYNIDQKIFMYNIENLINSKDSLIQMLKNPSNIFYLGSIKCGQYVFVYDKDTNQITAYYYCNDSYYTVYVYLLSCIKEFLNISSFSTNIYIFIKDVEKKFQNHIPDIISNAVYINDPTANENDKSFIELNITDVFMNYLLIKQIKNI